jgi:hypothetical protein
MNINPSQIRSMQGGTTLGSGGMQSDSVMTSGVMTCPVAIKYTGVSQWAITRNRLFLVDTQIGSIGVLKITDVKDSVASPGGIDIVTNWPGSYPARSYGSNGLWLIAHPAPICTFNNVTGSIDAQDLNGAPDGAPMWSYSKRTYDGSVVGSNPSFNVMGKLRKIVINVTKAYTGTVIPFTHTVWPGWAVDFPSGLNYAAISAIIDLRQTGIRQLDLTADSYPAFWTGGKGNDVLPSPGVSAAKWVSGNANVQNSIADIHLESPTLWPSFTVEIITDQGLT